MNLNNLKKGYKRDNDILKTIEMCGVMDTEQLTVLFFKFQSGRRKCQARMKSLCDRNLVNKVRLSIDTPNIYFHGKQPDGIKHSLELTWVYIWMNNRPGEKLLSWETEQLKDFGLRTDILCSTEILMTKEIRWYCIEFDRGSVSHSNYIKVELYDDLYKKEGYSGSKLMKKLGNPLRFPKVILITDYYKQRNKINNMVTASQSKVKFDVYLIDEIKNTSYSQL